MKQRSWKSRLYTMDYEEADALRNKLEQEGYVPVEVGGPRMVKLKRCGKDKKQFVVKTYDEQQAAA